MQESYRMNHSIANQIKRGNSSNRGHFQEEISAAQDFRYGQVAAA